MQAKICDNAVPLGLRTHSPAQRFRPFRRELSLDAEALDALYREHARKLLMFFVRRTMDAETATDLVAETFAAAFRDRRQFRGHTGDEAVGWLFGIARHQLASFYRRGSVEREALQRVCVERRDLTGEELERIEELAGVAEMRAQVRRRLEELDVGDQQILQLRIVEEREYDDIAAVLGVNEDAARARVSRALKRLRMLVGDPDDSPLELAA